VLARHLNKGTAFQFSGLAAGFPGAGGCFGPNQARHSSPRSAFPILVLPPIRILARYAFGTQPTPLPVAGDRPTPPSAPSTLQDVGCFLLFEYVPVRKDGAVGPAVVARSPTPITAGAAHPPIPRHLYPH